MKRRPTYIIRNIYLQRSLWVIIAQFFFGLVYSQTPSPSSPVSVRATINRDKILIGEPIELKLEARVPADANVQWFATDSIPRFEFIDRGKIDSSRQGAYSQTLLITSFDSGRVVIPALSLSYNGETYLTDSLPVVVSYSAFDPQQDYHDIKDILEVRPASNYLFWILIVSGSLLLLFLVFLWLRRRKRKKAAVPSEVPSRLSPVQEALQALDELKKEWPADKIFYTKLNDIIRWFVYRKTGLTTMQKTNDEFILQLEKQGLPQDEFIVLAQILRLCDVVKFAKFAPSESDKEHSWKVIRSSVQSINDKLK